MASTIAALAADLTEVATPLVCTCVVVDVDPLTVDALLLGPLGTDLILDLSWSFCHC